jgi:hypothetical protein
VVHGIDRFRLYSYVLVALAGMLAGMILCRFSESLRGGASSTPAQEPPVPHPRSLGP